ncbi:ABC transporter substrate-binding protein [Macrococcus hajekii]|uniref:ABC transporter substrate-binding protein n=1 Tax=Macrococcus hajekii TaxID=198482 RepID=A0A4R6BN37_9STAP|nr:zinc ABC transporter substrate-binding protein [Macrococcus hajekii]TDM03097.1 ABC transporter substrate-binding protein [Macrococcus hajekii]GGB06487.1 ABC transporter substrate-binding protein [Macrococcus hajekii]
MKKIVMMIAALLIVLAGCGNKNEDNGKLKVYTTVFPFKSMTEQIGGEHVDVESIYPNGIDIHTFEPTQKDTLNVAKGDLFIYSSDELDPVAAKIAKTVKNEKTLPVAKAIKENQLLEHDHDHEEGHDHEHEHEHEHAESAHDPHVWLDPVMDKAFAEQIKDRLVKEDPDHKADYEKNYAKLAKDIVGIDQQLKDITKNPKRDTVYISHDSLGYLANRYGFKQEGVSGMNNDEPSQREIVSLINQINELNAPYILYEQNIPSKITDIIKEKTETESLPFHNMAVLTDNDMKDKNVSYQSIMKKNIESLDKALNE